MDQNIAIQVRDLNKIYKLYDRPMDRLKEALGLSRKKRYKEHYALRNINMDIQVIRVQFIYDGMVCQIRKFGYLFSGWSLYH